MLIPSASTPVVCDMTGAPDTAHERLREFQMLFARFLIARERTSRGIRFRLRAEAGLEEHVRDLAAREQACCPFYAFDVTARDGQVLWECAVGDDETARAVLEEFFLLPETTATAPAELQGRLAATGLVFTETDAEADADAGVGTGTHAEGTPPSP
ncbi:hypothetical protein ABZ897_41105 [Nonomuraea sp. NPDC046802]|uniref:hypothetical protein n=1 Tax=Nonomuraea sp. NPDC046802 TaxID=3154919 RepID=UPI0033E2278B